jgi:hypothetical protein
VRVAVHLQKHEKYYQRMVRHELDKVRLEFGHKLIA